MTLQLTDITDITWQLTYITLELSDIPLKLTDIIDITWQLTDITVIILKLQISLLYEVISHKN